MLGHLASLKFYKEKVERNEIAYLQNPKICICCSEIIPYKKRVNDFCNRSCRTKHHNLKKGSKSNHIPRDIYFQNLRKTHAERRKDLFLSGKLVDRIAIKRTIIELLGSRECSICRLQQWNSLEIPLEVDHINGDASNNSPDNLRLLCPNCHAQTPTSKGKNRGRGRKSLGLPVN